MLINLFEKVAFALEKTKVCLILNFNGTFQGGSKVACLGVLPTFTISGGTNLSWGVKSVILYLKFISSYKIYIENFALGEDISPLSRACLGISLTVKKMFFSDFSCINILIFINFVKILNLPINFFK